MVHLVTAAEGALKFYTNKDNSVRTETPSLARELDAKILKHWQAHNWVRVRTYAVPVFTRVNGFHAGTACGYPCVTLVMGAHKDITLHAHGSAASQDIRNKHFFFPA